MVRFNKSAYYYLVAEDSFFCWGYVKQIVLIYMILFFRGFLKLLNLVYMQETHGLDSWELFKLSE